MFRALVFALCCVWLAGPALAQEDAGPPASSPPGASYSGQSISFSGSGFSLSSSPISFSSATISAAMAALGTPSAPVTQGMQIKEEKGGALRFTLNADLLFDFDKANLRPAADEVLRSLVQQVETRLPNGRFRIEGHTDGKGTDKYNDQLSLRRAKSVEAWLAKNARVPARRMTTAALGKRRPVAPNAKPDGSDDPDGRQKNRRVEILVAP